MRKLLYITTALVSLASADPAEAAPVGAWVASSVFGLTAGTASFALVSGAVTMGISAGIQLAIQRARGKPRQEALRTELTRPTSLPAYRFVYGNTWAPGTPVAWHVKGKKLYVCYLLNSRPSAGPFEVFFDKRKVEFTGNPLAFSGSGATASNDPFSGHAQYWIGDGTQTTCPAQIVSETDGHFLLTDAWRGRTVLWVKLDCGGDKERSERWPATPPEVNVGGNWSIIEDVRDGQQKFSRNQALIVLDALRKNPLRPYADAYLRLDTFAWGADVADDPVAVKGGGSIPRYSADGVLVFADGAELEDQLEPLLSAGASRFSRIGGRLAFIPAVARPSVKTITDLTDGQTPDFIRWRSSDELYTESAVRYPAPDRAFESAETPVQIIPGAQEEDGGTPKRLLLDLDFVIDHRQGQRVGHIMAMRSRMQRGVTGEQFPDGFDLVSGSVASLSLGFPFGSWTGKYEVESIAPAAGLMDDQSITVQLPTVLRQESDAIYAWDAATQEQDVISGGSITSIGRIQSPASVSVVTGTAAAITSGDTVIAGVTAGWPASMSASVTGYEWEWQRRTGSGSWSVWRSGGALDVSAADGVGVYSATIQWPTIGDGYRVRVASIGTWGKSAWRVSPEIIAAGPEVVIPAPGAPTATAQGANRINVGATQIADGRARVLLIYSNTVDSPLTATLKWEVPASASVAVSRADTGLPSGTTRYYFARTRDQWGNLSDFSASGSATTA